MNYIINALKSLPRRGQHNIQKVICLALGMAVGAVLITELHFDQTYDQWYDDWDRTYIIKETVIRDGDGKPAGYWQTPGAIAPGMKRYASMVEAATRTTDIGYGIECRLDAEHALEADVMAADTSFFDIFPRPILSGNAHEVLAKPLCCMVSRSVAQALGGEVMGRKFTMADYGDTPFEIGGIFEDFPWHSSLHGTQVLVSMATLNESSTNNWMGNDRYMSYIRLARGHKADEIQPFAQKMLEENVDMEAVRSAGVEVDFVPYLLSERHTHDEHVRMMDWIMGIMAVVLLSLSVMNYLLIAIGNMVGRSTEMAVRKCFGASRGDIGVITLTEAGVHVALAMLLAGALLTACRGSIETYLSAPLMALLGGRACWLLAVTGLAIVLLAGVVPAWLYGRVPVATVFRGYARNRRRWKLGLLASEFCIVALFACLLYTVQAQYWLMVGQNPGYDCREVAILEVQGTSAQDKAKLLQELSRMPQVQAVSSAWSIPLEQYGVSGDNVLLPGDDREIFNATDLYDVSDGYLQVMGMKLSQGTFFTSRTDDCEQVLVSESFAQRVAQAAHWTDGALGKRVRITGHTDEAYAQGVTIVGIFPDIKVGGCSTDNELRKGRPQFITYSTQVQEHMLLRLHQLTPEAMTAVRNRVEALQPGRVVKLKSWDAELRAQYHSEISFRNVTAICVAVTLCIALLGLLGYTADEVNRRSKEMAVRKVNGARGSDIVLLFLTDVMRMAVPSVLVGAVLAWCIARQWLTSFSLKAEFSPVAYLCMLLAVLMVIALSVVVNCRRVAQANPVKYLKNE